MVNNDLFEKYIEVRKKSELLCNPLITEDFSVQPIEFVSPPKWHLAHITWFWEQFVLVKYMPNYVVFSEDFAYLFNSYYNNIGKRVLRTNRGNMTRPEVSEVMKYRAYVDNAMHIFLKNEVEPEVKALIEVGINHEQQHQELLVYDIKYILGTQPAFYSYGGDFNLKEIDSTGNFEKFPEGIYEIGSKGNDFCFDNELGLHKVYINDFEISENLVSNAEFLEFINDGGYKNFNFWHDDGWSWKDINKITSPLYWHFIEDEWYEYELNGLKKLKHKKPVKHISFYEAAAFAAWKGMRLPTECEWEIASEKLNWGQLWEWTNSAYLPYPYFKKAEGALGEYNGKFMINSMVLRGASVATPNNHSRKTYRNFFYPNMRWMYSGIRLVK